MLRWWLWEYTRPDSYYGHAVFIPVLIGLMLWHRRDALKAAGMQPRPAALGLVVPALALFVIALRTEMQAVMSWAFLLTVAGSVWYLCGTRILRIAAIPLLFLALMAPLPGPVLNDATLGLQRLSTIGASELLGLLGMGAHRQGNLIYLENFTLNVDVPCSGFKLLLSLLTFSAAFADLTDASRGRKWLLFLISLPLSLVINTIRISSVGIVGECMGASAARQFHDLGGLLSLILCMAILFLIAKALGCRKLAGQQLF